MDDILKYDSEFSESKFKTFVDNVFIQIHLAIMTKEIEKIKHFVNEEVYKTLEEKVRSLGNYIQMYDEINVKQTTILNIEKRETEIEIKVNITSRYMDYLMDENGNFVRGNNTSRIEKENYLTFTKKIDAKELGNVRKCPGCGATVDVNANGQCEYCGTTFNLEDRSWVMTSIKTI